MHRLISKFVSCNPVESTWRGADASDGKEDIRITEHADTGSELTDDMQVGRPEQPLTKLRLTVSDLPP